MQTLRRTSNHRVASIVRLLLGVLFVMTGLMKLAVPILALAWSGQLLAAGVPLYSFVRWTIPFVEMLVGVMLMTGALARVASLLAIGIMIPATYVHVVVDDPSLFPLQPSEPIVPLTVIAMSAYVLWKGAGSWILDLKATRAAGP